MDENKLKEILITTFKEIGVATREDILASERRMKLRMGKHKTDVTKMIGSLALTTPTRNEFEELKNKVESKYN